MFSKRVLGGKGAKANFRAARPLQFRRNAAPGKTRTSKSLRGALMASLRAFSSHGSQTGGSRGLLLSLMKALIILGYFSSQTGLP